MPQIAIPTEIKKRDLLWLSALLASGLDLRDVQRIVAEFNALRDKAGAP